ncbi:Anaphase-promoting complex subunit 23 [Rhizophlyctis rosea]|uniref:Anaphase-promoting complex subunit 23 n=1 Tax=Rhizophlyctis rosea TaxID=64517 RepID=A0AAD5S9Y6_9FUNG|nr:Anaphase-promoting complex subunit 23 [Rhizophlyctis rosea]
MLCWSFPKTLAVNAAKDSQSNDKPATTFKGRLEKAICTSWRDATFQNREYARVAERLKRTKGPKATFLRLYAYYLRGEKEEEEKYTWQETPLEDGQWFNMELQDIERELEKGCHKDAFCLYLYA